jgi:hypothetical protein
MKSRLAVFVFAALALLISTGADCGGQRGFPRDPWPPAGPESTWTGVSTVFQVVTTIDTDAIRYVTDWGDATDTTGAHYASQETAAVAHAWAAPGAVSIKVKAFNAAFPEKVSDWSQTKSVRVIPDSQPVIDTVLGPPVAVKGVEAFFTIKGHDPDGDSVRAVVDWDDSTGTTTGLFPSPCSVEVTHVFWQVDTATVVVNVQDWKGAPSQPETIYVMVGTPGGKGPYNTGKASGGR